MFKIQRKSLRRYSVNKTENDKVDKNKKKNFNLYMFIRNEERLQQILTAKIDKGISMGAKTENSQWYKRRFGWNTNVDLLVYKDDPQ